MRDGGIVRLVNQSVKRESGAEEAEDEVWEEWKKENTLASEARGTCLKGKRKNVSKDMKLIILARSFQGKKASGEKEQLLART